MRSIIVLVLSFLLVAPVLSQPSQKEIQAQMAEAKQGALQQIADMEKDIATARLKEENPETIKEMEDRLATMKKMLGVIDKAGSQNKRPTTLPASKNVEPKYVSPFVPITLRQPVKVPTKEQAKDQLFWYIGKKIDANTLVTTEGLLVRHDRPNNRLIIQPDKRVDTPYYGLVNTLAQTTNVKNDFVVKMDGIENSFFMFPEIYKAYKEFDHLRNVYYKMAENTIDLPPLPIEYLDPDLERMHSHLAAMNDRLNAMMRNLPDITRGTLAPAPERPHNQCTCDTIPLIAFRERLPFWVYEFYKEEVKLWDMIADMNNQMEHFKEKGGTVLRNWNETISAAKSLKLHRESQKLLLFVDIYEQEENIYKEDALSMAATRLMINLSNFQGNSPDDQSYRRLAESGIRQAKDLVFKNFFKDYIADQKSQRNYDVVFDYSLYASHEWNKKLFERGYNISDNLVNIWMKGLNKFNRFTLNITMDFELHFLDEHQEILQTSDGFLKSDPLFVSLGQNDCKWQLYVWHVNYRDRNTPEEKFHIRIKVMQGKKDYLFDKKPPFYYSKPGYMQMVFPVFRISLCRDGSGQEIEDSVYMDVMRYSDTDLRIHKNADYSKEYSTDMLMYANKMFLGIKEIEINNSKLDDIAGKMIGIRGTTQMPRSTGHPILDQMMMEFFTNQQKQILQRELSGTSHTGKTVIPFQAENFTHVFMQETHETTDPNDKDKKVGIKLIRGNVIMRVQHTPLP